MTTAFFRLSSRLARYAVSIINIFFFNDTTTTEIYTLSLHDALPILKATFFRPTGAKTAPLRQYTFFLTCRAGDRKSTRLNSSHMSISYAVFCLKKKKKDGLIQALESHSAGRGIYQAEVRPRVLKRIA